MIPELPRIIALRATCWFTATRQIDDRLVWSVVEGDLPQLLTALTEMLDTPES